MFSENSYKRSNQSRQSLKNKLRSIRRTKLLGFCFSIWIPLLYIIFSTFGFIYIVPIMFNFDNYIESISNPPQSLQFIPSSISYSSSSSSTSTTTSKSSSIRFNLLFFRFYVFIIVFLGIWSFLKASYTHPGPVPKVWKEWTGRLSERPNDPIYAQCTNNERGTSLYFPKRSKLYCQQCSHFRPPRTAHCSRCGICVTRMDHHCSFINNCVGSNNHRYFLQFLIYVFLAFSTYIICSLGVLIKLSSILGVRKCIQKVLLTRAGHMISFIFLPIIAIPFTLFIAVMMLGQVMYLSKNQTFVERKFEREMNVINKRRAARDKKINENEINKGKTTICHRFAEWLRKWREEREKREFESSEDVLDNDENELLMDGKKENVNNVSNTKENKTEPKGLIDDNYYRSSYSSYRRRKMNKEAQKRNYDTGSTFENVYNTIGGDIIRWFIPFDLTKEMRKYRMESDNEYETWSLPPWKKHDKLFAVISKRLKCKKWNKICCGICRKFNCCVKLTYCCLFNENGDDINGVKVVKTAAKLQYHPNQRVRRNIEIYDEKSDSDAAE